jgi:tRNA G18 (ribose-2'-O)-methylase SpoU
MTLPQPSIVVIAHNIRSTHNVGAILRTCDGFGISRVVCSGYTPYPSVPGDTRLPHMTARATRQIAKTALGAETTVTVDYIESIEAVVADLAQQGYRIVGLEQDAQSVVLGAYSQSQPIALLLGEEVHGIDQSLRTLCDDLVEIPMRGRKESFNVSVATGIALYHLAVVMPTMLH